jgi:hypothetical protein
MQWDSRKLSGLYPQFSCSLSCITDRFPPRHTLLLEDGGITLLQNVSKYLPHYTTSHLHGQHSHNHKLIARRLQHGLDASDLTPWSGALPEKPTVPQPCIL